MHAILGAVHIWRPIFGLVGRFANMGRHRTGVGGLFCQSGTSEILTEKNEKKNGGRFKLSNSEYFLWKCKRWFFLSKLMEHLRASSNFELNVPFLDIELILWYSQKKSQHSHSTEENESTAKMISKRMKAVLHID